MSDTLRSKQPAQSPEYIAWHAMKQRCYYQKGLTYKYYGGVGVTVCQRWRDSFSAFLEDMGHKPTPSHSLDRFPCAKGNYEPGNVRWATIGEQARNKPSFNVNVTIDGETRCVYGETGWLLKVGMSDYGYRRRINKGMSPAEALTAPKVIGRPRPHLTISHNGETLSLEEWGKRTGIPRMAIYHRVKVGWPIDKALTTPSKRPR